MRHRLRVTSGTLRHTENARYHRYQDAETGETLACVNRDAPGPGYRASTPAGQGPLRATMNQARQDAHWILRHRGYTPPRPQDEK